jgi:DNA-directed RNA polymerase specialized sigma24 family protein
MDDRRNASRVGAAHDLAGAIQKGWETLTAAGVSGAGTSKEDNQRRRWEEPHGVAGEELLQLFESWLRQQPDMVRDFLELVYVVGISPEDAAARVTAGLASTASALARRRAALEMKVVRALNSFRRFAIDWHERTRPSHGGNTP